MKLSTLSLVILSSVTFSAALQATSQAPSLAPKSSQLVHLPVLEATIEKQPVHFSQAINSDLQPQFGLQSVSDEYWLEVDGETLNNGLMLNVNQPESLIRLSAKQSIGQPLPDNHAIDPQFLELRKDKRFIEKAFSQRVSQEQMATASILANSSAVKMSAAAGTGQFQLRVSQQLAPTQKYIINVKEKGSAYRQSLVTNQQAYLAGGQASFKATMANHDSVLSNTSHRTFIKAPNGEMNEVSYVVNGDQFQVDLPTYVQNEMRGQLFELHVESTANDNGKHVLRHGKLAFAVAAPTARMTIEGASLQSASINLDVASEGRYALSGIVYGQDSSGAMQPLMQSSSAYYLSPGQQTVALEFDQSLLNASSLSAPYSLGNTKLVDQSRISVLQRQPAQQRVVMIAEKVEKSSGALSLMTLLGLIGVGGLVRRRRD